MWLNRLIPSPSSVCLSVYTIHILQILPMQWLIHSLFAACLFFQHWQTFATQSNGYARTHTHARTHTQAVESTVHYERWRHSDVREKTCGNFSGGTQTRKIFCQNSAAVFRLLNHQRWRLTSFINSDTQTLSYSTTTTKILRRKIHYAVSFSSVTSPLRWILFSRKNFISVSQNFFFRKEVWHHSTTPPQFEFERYDPTSSAVTGVAEVRQNAFIQ